MLSSADEGLIGRLYEAAIRERRFVLSSAFAEVKNHASAIGALRSGRTSVGMTEQARLELKTRAALAWDIIQRVLSDTGVTLDQATVSAIKELMLRHIEMQKTEVLKELRDGLPGDLSFNASVVENECIGLRADYDAIIDLFVAKFRTQVPSSLTGPVFNFHGPVGALQTGAGAVANVSQAIPDAALQHLISAMKQLESLLAAAADIPEASRTELMSVAGDVRSEASSPKPNRTKIRLLASGIASTIQTTASLRPAYEVVKAALAHVGVILP